jgi:hypothetical protein
MCSWALQTWGCGILNARSLLATAIARPVPQSIQARNASRGDSPTILGGIVSWSLSLVGVLRDGSIRLRHDDMLCQPIGCRNSGPSSELSSGSWRNSMPPFHLITYITAILSDAQIRLLQDSEYEISLQYSNKQARTHPFPTPTGSRCWGVIQPRQSSHQLLVPARLT